MKPRSSTSDATTKSAQYKFAATIFSLLLFAILVTGSVRSANPAFPDAPTTLVEDSVEKTVRAAAANGWVACPGECLKLSQPGWQHKQIRGFSDSDVWMVYPFTDPSGEPSWQAYTQRHIGHIIKVYPNKAAEDTGNCPICNGTGWVRKDDPHVKR